MKIRLEHVARIEGHAHLVVDARSGELRECRLEVVEAPRFFEVLLRGRPHGDVAPIAARICGVCSNSHTLVSLAATEAALGIQVSAQTLDLRRLLALGEILQSHLLQLHFMVLPDYLGVAGVVPMARTHRELVTRALRLKKLANDICAAVGGRPVHPVTPCVGGFSALPEATVLQGLRRRLVGVLPDLEATVDLFGSLDVPAFARPTESLCLAGDGTYPLFADTICCSGGPSHPVARFRTLIEEIVVPHSQAKFARTPRGTYQVGPLARFKNAHAALSPMAAKVAAALGLEPTTDNPHHAVWARLVEVVHGVEEAIRLIDSLLAVGLVPEPPVPLPAAGETATRCGVAAIEAPRGILFHAYEYDESARIVAADCVIPTAQNLGNIEADLRALVPQLAGSDRATLESRLEMLLRAYDPCISCATHRVRIQLD